MKAQLKKLDLIYQSYIQKIEPQQPQEVIEGETQVVISEKEDRDTVIYKLILEERVEKCSDENLKKMNKLESMKFTGHLKEMTWGKVMLSSYKQAWDIRNEGIQNWIKQKEEEKRENDKKMRVRNCFKKIVWYYFIYCIVVTIGVMALQAYLFNYLSEQIREGYWVHTEPNTHIEAHEAFLKFDDSRIFEYDSLQVQFQKFSEASHLLNGFKKFVGDEQMKKIKQFEMEDWFGYDYYLLRSL